MRTGNKLYSGKKIRNIEFVRWINRPTKLAEFRCPFCENLFKSKFENIQLNGSIYSCGCMDAEDARAYYYAEIAKQLPLNGFIVTAAARNAGVPLSMLEAFKKDEAFMEILNEAIEQKKDAIEKKFLEKINQGHMTAISLAVKSTFMKDRGYCPAIAEASQQTQLNFGEKLIDDLI